MDDNVWEYPFGDLDDDDEMFYQKPEVKTNKLNAVPPAFTGRRMGFSLINL